MKIKSFYSKKIDYNVFKVWLIYSNGLNYLTKKERFVITESVITLNDYDFNYDKCIEVYLKNNGYKSMADLVMDKENPKEYLSYLIAKTQFNPNVADFICEEETFNETLNHLYKLIKES